MYIFNAVNKVHARRARTGRLAAPLKVAYLSGDSLQVITGQVEFSQGEDLTHTFGENPQSVVRQVQAPQLGKPAQMETERGPVTTKSPHLVSIHEPHLSSQVVSSVRDI